MRCSRRPSPALKKRIKYSAKKNITRQTSFSDSERCNADASLEEQKGSIHNYDPRSMTPMLIFRPDTPSLSKF